jgi:hypothetical protein
MNVDGVLVGEERPIPVAVRFLARLGELGAPGSYSASTQSNERVTAFFH